MNVTQQIDETILSLYSHPLQSGLNANKLESVSYVASGSISLKNALLNTTEAYCASPSGCNHHLTFVGGDCTPGSCICVTV